MTLLAAILRVSFLVFCIVNNVIIPAEGLYESPSISARKIATAEPIPAFIINHGFTLLILSLFILIAFIYYTSEFIIKIKTIISITMRTKYVLKE